jgi:hypothetical protein
MMKRVAWWMVSLVCLSAACSLVNAPDEPFEPKGKGGGGDGGQGGSGGQPECVGNAECAALSDECNDGVCNAGFCEAMPVADGTACGDPSDSACDAMDTCIAGVCEANLAVLGTPCNDCPAGPGQCAGCQDGLCGDCSTFATAQTFVHPSSLDGWELTGDWRLYQEAPRNAQSLDPVDFPGVVLGTDGNRSQPYPGGENEISYARTKPTTLPAVLEFMSWHVDEGGFGIDTKEIRISVDGGLNWTTVALCQGGPLSQFPFCQFVGDGRPADQWDSITITVPAALVGQEGIVEFSYNTGDSCCSFERGWYLTNLNFATGCACDSAAACGWANSECATASCHGSGECRLATLGQGMACGDTSSAECDNPDTCDAFGYCRERSEPDSIDCYDCKGGVDDCNKCAAGVCQECMNLPAVNTFDSALDISGWERTMGWNRYTQAPVSSFTTTVIFPSPVFGTDGNRVPPYPGAETENSYARTLPFVVPNQITFQSWHVDEGSGVDTKQLRLSMDGGMSWIAIVDCEVSTMNGYPFCQYFNQNRLANQWDAIVVDTSAYAGQVARLEFTYNTGDNCCSFERGWFIDDLNVARRCLD